MKSEWWWKVERAEREIGLWEWRRNIMDVMFSQDPSAYHIENGPQAAEGGTWEIKSTHSRPEKEQTHIKTLVLTISHFLCLMKHVYIHYLI